MFANGRWGKWRLGANGHLGERGTPSSLKRYSKCPWVHLSEIFTNGHRKANGHVRGKNEHLDKGYPKCPNIPVPISPQMSANGQWGKWTLGKSGHFKEKSALCPLPLNV